MEFLFKDVPLLNAGVNRKGLRMADVLQGLLVGGGLAIYGKVGALHFAGWRGRTAAGVLWQMMQFVQGSCSTFQVLAKPQKEIRVRGGNKLLAVVALR